MRCCSFFFFFSSRRRHTRFDCDWSSDVCSSDLSSRPCRATGSLGSRRNVSAQPHRTQDRKSTRLNSSHSQISYAVFCLKKKNNSPVVFSASICTSSSSAAHDYLQRSHVQSARPV